MPEREVVNNKIIEILDEVVINSSDIEYHDQTNLKNDLALDSLGLIHLIMNLNEAFDIEINSQEIIPENFATMGLLEKFIITKLEK